jgi:hypothetical protein
MPRDNKSLTYKCVFHMQTNHLKGRILQLLLISHTSGHYPYAGTTPEPGTRQLGRTCSRVCQNFSDKTNPKSAYLSSTIPSHGTHIKTIAHSFFGSQCLLTKMELLVWPSVVQHALFPWKLWSVRHYPFIGNYLLICWSHYSCIVINLILE